MLIWLREENYTKCQRKLKELPSNFSPVPLV